MPRRSPRKLRRPGLSGTCARSSQSPPRPGGREETAAVRRRARSSAAARLLATQMAVSGASSGGDRDAAAKRLRHRGHRRDPRRDTRTGGIGADARGPDEDDGPAATDDGRPRGNMRLLVAGLIAVIVGLVIAVDRHRRRRRRRIDEPRLRRKTTSLDRHETTSRTPTTETTETTEPTTETTPTEPTTTTRTHHPRRRRQRRDRSALAAAAHPIP